jgi:hypothetical protein
VEAGSLQDAWNKRQHRDAQRHELIKINRAYLSDPRTLPSGQVVHEQREALTEGSATQGEAGQG